MSKELPRSDSQEAKDAIEKVFAERNYPCSPTAAARCGWEAAYRAANLKAEATAGVGGGNTPYDEGNFSLAPADVDGLTDELPQPTLEDQINVFITSVRYDATLLMEGKSPSNVSTAESLSIAADDMERALSTHQNAAQVSQDEETESRPCFKNSLWGDGDVKEDV